MIIKFEDENYQTVIKKPILQGDLYYDCMTHEIKKCKSFICFDPWSPKLEKIKKKENEK